LFQFNLKQSKAVKLANFAQKPPLASQEALFASLRAYTLAPLKAHLASH